MMINIPFATFLFRALGALVIVTLSAQASPATAEAEGQVVVILPFARPEGFALAPMTLNDQSELAVYGATSPAANWGVMQWGNPGDSVLSALPGFAFNPKNIYGVLASWTSAMPGGGSSVAVELHKNGAWTETLSQSGNTCPDDQSDEYDLFLQNNNKTLEPLWPSAYHWDNNHEPIPTLSQMSSLTVSGTLTVSEVSMPQPQSPCSVNQVVASFSLVFGNRAANPPQTLFYQIALTNFCLPNAPKWCGGAGTAYFEGGENSVFGIDDNSLLASYGRPRISNYAPRNLQLNILPVITRLILEGSAGSVPGVSATAPYHLDTDTSHWILEGIYYGQQLWGNTQMTSTWQGFVPVITLK